MNYSTKLQTLKTITLTAFFLVIFGLSYAYAQACDSTRPTATAVQNNPTSQNLRKSAPDKKTIMIIESPLNVRSSPDVGSNIIGRYNKGDTIEIQEKSPNGFWCKVNYKGKNGWVVCENLREQTDTSKNDTLQHQAAPRSNIK